MHTVFVAINKTFRCLECWRKTEIEKYFVLNDTDLAESCYIWFSIVVKEAHKNRQPQHPY